MYEDILGPKSVDELRKIRNRKFTIEKKEKEEDQLDLFEDLELELEEIE